MSTSSTTKRGELPTPPTTMRPRLGDTVHPSNPPQDTTTNTAPQQPESTDDGQEEDNRQRDRFREMLGRHLHRDPAAASSSSDTSQPTPNADAMQPPQRSNAGYPTTPDPQQPNAADPDTPTTAEEAAEAPQTTEPMTGNTAQQTTKARATHRTTSLQRGTPPTLQPQAMTPLSGCPAATVAGTWRLSSHRPNLHTRLDDREMSALEQRGPLSQPHPSPSAWRGHGRR